MPTSETLLESMSTIENGQNQNQSESKLDALESLISDAFLLLRPENPMTVSEWAERYRYMSSLETSRPGPWRNDIVPYLKDIMDTFNRDGV